ncbi:MAG TPA: zinc-dependent alcohol dehydrogenase family protein [Actinokineospora sp.]|nr:zinc-dependent alcohol dehydrogenase family protein [Actinokineospora sp.]
MKALRYDGPGAKTWTDVPDARVESPTDAVVRVDAVTICGTDLHILNGDVPTVDSGRVLGHEAVGTVTDVGSAVSTIKPGDRVLVSCISACGRCAYCREGSYGQCLGGGGWILGHRVDGTQAEYVRVPFADTSTHLLPAGLSAESALMLADILPTSYEVGVLNGGVQPGDTVAIVGAGPIGLAAITTAKLFSPGQIIAIDIAAPRRDAAKRFGADILVDPAGDPVAEVMALTDGLGADVVIEAVGAPAAFELCTRLVRPGGHVANVGVHGEPSTLHLEDLWMRNITITTGLVDTSSTPRLLRMLATGHLTADEFVTHRFELGDIETAYDVFSRPMETGALKIALLRTLD